MSTPAPQFVPHPPDGAPNVVVVLLDDVGFGASAEFGGPVHTPTASALAAEGLRFNRFHTTAICSPTRASLLTGRDAHVTGVGTVMGCANPNSGYEGVLRDSTVMIPRILRDAGYSTACFGKWHLTPPWEASQIGPFNRWPTGRGFDTFYGFLSGETHQWEPTLYSGTTPVHRPDQDSYHLTDDLVDRAIDWVRMQRAVAPDRPFFLYLAPGATHAPLHVPREYADRYRGRFAHGWDKMREEIHDRQCAAGIVPPGTELTARPEELPAWDDLSSDQQRVAERLMEVYAGFLEHTDVAIGRLVTSLKDSGQFDDTLFVYIVGDNGPSAEAGPDGSINYFGALQGLGESLEDQLAALDDVGGPDSYPQYPAGWAWAMSSPFQWVKQVASHFGGTRNPMLVSWPRRITDAGGMRSQFAHVNDIVPTILEATGVPAPTVVDGVDQAPIDGVSMVYAFDDPGVAERHTTQYFEVFGHRSVYHEGWIASAFHHAGMPWTAGLPPVDASVDDDVWELYDTTADFSQARDLATERPDKLAELQEIFDKEAERVGILPLRDARVDRGGLPTLAGARDRFVYHRGAVGIPETQGPPLRARSWTVTARIVVPDGGARGVLVSIGGSSAGFSLYLTENGCPELVYRTFEVSRLCLAGTEPALPGLRVVEAVVDYDGGPPGAGATISLRLDGEVLHSGRVERTPRGLFSVDETLDIGETTGSPVGPYSSRFPFIGEIEEVEFLLT